MDLGGAVGQLLAVDRPERLARLVLVDTVSYARRLAGDIPGPRLIVEQAGHFVMEEVPDRGADEIVAFLSRSPGAW